MNTMLKTALVLISILTVSSCNVVQDQYLSSRIGDRFDLIDSPEWSRIRTIEQAGYWVRENIDYDMSRDDIAEWASPQQTMDRRYGTCADMAILFMNIVYVRLGLRSDLVAVDSASARKIEAGGFTDHAAVRINGTVYEYSGVRRPYVVGYSFSFNEVFR